MNWKTFLNSPPSPLVIGCGFLIVTAIAGGSLRAYNLGQQQLGRQQLELQHSDSVLHQLTAQLDSVSKAKRVDTLRLVRWQNHYGQARTLVDTLPPLILHDTAYIPRPVVQQLEQAADSQQHACLLLAQDCEQQRQLLTAQLEQRTHQLELVRRELPSPLAPWWDRLVGASIGYTVCRLGAR